MTLGSLFDGIGGFPLAGVMCGITPVWASEIEPFPLKVTAARFPEMKQLGSVTEINGAEIEPVDIITFGSPCQDLSVAGKQLGIHEGQRSNLFFEAIRIIKEMRNADRANGRSGVDIRPRFAIWENVPGAFSSNKGEDFRTVLEALGGIVEDGLSIPRPARWNHAGCVVGNGWSIAWRVYDAQYWGVPQRRKRIYLVADFASECAGEILFEREGVSGDSSESRAAREGTAADVEGGAGGGCGVGLTNRGYVSGDKSETLRAESHMALPCVVQPAAFMGGQGAKARSIAYCEDGTTPTIRSTLAGGNAIPEVCYALQGNGIDRADTAGCNGSGWREGEMYTLNTIDRPEVVFPETARTLAARHDSSPCVDRGQNVVCYGVDCRNGVLDEERTHTIQAKANGGMSLNCTPSVCYRNGGYGGMVEGVGTLRANGGDAGGGTESIVVECVRREGER